MQSTGASTLARDVTLDVLMQSAQHRALFIDPKRKLNFGSLEERIVEMLEHDCLLDQFMYEPLKGMEDNMAVALLDLLRSLAHEPPDLIIVDDLDFIAQTQMKDHLSEKLLITEADDPSPDGSFERDLKQFYTTFGHLIRQLVVTRDIRFYKNIT